MAIIGRLLAGRLRYQKTSRSAFNFCLSTPVQYESRNPPSNAPFGGEKRQRQGEFDMSLPESILDLVTDTAAADSLSDSDRLEKAAGLVQDFVQDSGLAALDALLEAADQGGLAGGESALATAAEVSQQTAVLEGEVQRFLTTNPGSRQKR